jgi:hypothetical protein
MTACGPSRSEWLPNNSPVPDATPTPSAKAQEPKKPDQVRPLDKHWDSSFRFRTRSVSEKHDGYCPYELSAEYPQLASRQTNARKFNRWIKRKILGDVARFRRLELNAEPRARQEGKRLLTEGLELTFEVYYANDRLISLRLTHDVMAARQMHPIAYCETINYDLNKHRPLRASDVFKRGYLHAFSSYSRKYLQDTYEIRADDWFIEGTEARARNFPNWNIVPDGILISFEDYQVGPHSFGQPELIVPYSVLGRHLRRQSVLGYFMRGDRKTSGRTTPLPQSRKQG